MKAYDLSATGRHEDARAIVGPVLARRLASSNPASALPALRLHGTLSVALGRLPDALGDFRRSLEVSEAWIAQGRTSLTETQMARAMAYLRVDEELIYSIAADHPSDRQAAELALTFATLRKGRLTGEVTKTFGVFEHVSSSSSGLGSLRDVRGKYALSALLGASPAELTRLEAASETIEKALLGTTAIAQLAAGMMDMSVAPSLALGQLGMAATMGTMLVDIEQFRRFRFGGTPGAAGAGEFGAPEYLGLLLRDGDQIRVVPLGAAEPIDASSRRLVKALSDPDKPYEAAARDTYDTVVKPLAAEMQGDVNYTDPVVYFSPDGELGTIPFAALHDDKGPLLDRFRLSYLDSPRDLWGSRRGGNLSTTVKILAAPNFSGTIPKGSLEGQDCGSLRASSIPPLPGTVDEAAALRGLMPLAQVKTGDESTRVELLSTNSPGILHVATHGIFMNSTSVPMPTRGLVLETEPQAQSGTEGALRRNPLVRSALLLSAAQGSSDGGVATALEIGGMNLEGTQLVVLSACDTARGDIRLGQGVYGLRRAFALAGARTVVTSLWKVDDSATRDLMVRYYTALLQGESKADAMRGAARALRKDHPHPYFWAPFIVSGDTGALKGKEGEGIPAIAPPRRGIVVQPVYPVEPVIIGPH